MREGCLELRNAITLAATQSLPKRQRLTEITARLSPDEVAVYQAVLQKAGRREGHRLNISMTTTPLSPDDFGNCECFEGIDLDNLASPFHSYHHLSIDLLPEKQMRLVNAENQAIVVHENDPSTTIREGPVKDAVEKAFTGGLFSLSEIAFDKDRHYAVVSYRLWCGMLCGNGATLVIEKIGNDWKVSDRNCGSWIS